MALALGLLLAGLQDTPSQKLALEKVNAIRKAAGLGAVTFDSDLSKGCSNHAKYILRNQGHPSVQGLGAHDEDPKLPGFTEEGRRAGKSSDIGWVDLPQAVDGWMASLFHRVPILDPRLQSVGMAAEKGGKWGWVALMDLTSGLKAGPWEDPVLWPPDGMKDVPTDLGRELPNPIPKDADGKGGYPVTAIFPFGREVKGATMVLKAGKTIVPVWLSTPEEPVDPRFQRNTVCVIARDALKPKTVYTVELTATAGDQAVRKTWSFTTR